MTQRTSLIVGIIILIVLVGGIAAYALGYLRFVGFMPHFGSAGALPTLNDQIIFSTDFPEASREAYRAKIEEARTNIKNGQDDPSAWLDLALLYRAVGDNESAVQIWEYLVEKYPGDYTSLRNLGEYYFHTAKDYGRAEDYYRKAIDVNPSYGIAYSDLHEMYRYATNDQAKAVNILEEGISKATEDQALDLRMMLATYYRDMDKKQDARQAFTEARAVAQKLGNTTLVRAIDQELARLQ